MRGLKNNFAQVHCARVLNMGSYKTVGLSHETALLTLPLLSNNIPFVSKYEFYPNQNIMSLFRGWLKKRQKAQ